MVEKLVIMIFNEKCSKRYIITIMNLHIKNKDIHWLITYEWFLLMMKTILNLLKSFSKLLFMNEDRVYFSDVTEKWLKGGLIWFIAQIDWKIKNDRYLLYTMIQFFLIPKKSTSSNCNYGS
jgi:hypothetical protein